MIYYEYKNEMEFKETIDLVLNDNFTPKQFKQFLHFLCGCERDECFSFTRPDVIAIIAVILSFIYH